MLDSDRSLRRSRFFGHRIVACALFTLQGAIALSPLWESGSQGRLGMHAEQEGSRHAGLHNEDACAVCSVRSLHASAPLQTGRSLAVQPKRAPLAVARQAAPTRDSWSTHLSRAPPLTG
jgi:hypothetical protein